MMDRRAFITILGGSIITAPFAGEAQQARKVTVGWLLPDPKSFALDPFRQRLKELGWTECGDLVIEQRYSHGNAARYPQLAAEFVQLKVDALVTDGSAATKAAQRTTPRIPIVFVAGDPIAQGFVASLSHPGKNLTGVAIQTGDVSPKRIQLLKEAVPGMSRLAILEDVTGAGLATADIRLAGNWQGIEAASRTVGIRSMATLQVRKPEELDGAFDLAISHRVDGVLVLASPFFSSHGQQIADLAAKTRLPAIYEHRGFVEVGGLMSYGPDHRDIFDLVARYVDRILRGAKPGDLPVEQPTKFELVINLKTAKTLGLTIAQSLLMRADQVIE
jgi:putative ABC transport system substrate-binding protein